jgi:acyl carrier protein
MKRDNASASRQAVIDEIRAHLSGWSSQAGESTVPAITDDLVLGTGGLGISSLVLLRIFVRLEEKFGVTFEDAAVAGATFRTVGDLVRFASAAHASK